MEAPKVLYVRVYENAAFKTLRFEASDKLEDFKESGPIATYRLARVGHLNVERNLSKAAIGAPDAPSPRASTPVKRRGK